MPVLSEPYHGVPSLSDIPPLYICLGAVLLLLCCGILIRRNFSSRTCQISGRMPPPTAAPTIVSSSEKEALLSKTQPAAVPSHLPVIMGMTHFQRPLLSLPFTPPVPFTPPPVQGQQTELNTPSFAPAMDTMPRRRSYTSTTSNGTEVSGEIIMAEGWRRHTRVFGGGVCEACAESERRLSA